MKRNQHQVISKSSRPSAVPQSKTARSRAGDRPASASPCIALFPEGDGGASEEIIHLSKAEYAELKRAAAATRDGALMFMAKAGLEKARWPGRAGNTPSLHGIIGPSPALKEPVLLEGAVTFIFKAPDGRELERVDFPPDVFKRIQRAASKEGISLQEFCRTAIRHFIDSQDSRRAA
jgi:hypothetical protein